MKKVIEEIVSGLKEGGFERLEERLGGGYLWERDYPIAVVHTKERIKEKEIVRFFEKEDLLDTKGFTPSEFTKEELESIAKNASAYLQQATMMCLYKPTPFPQVFKSKFPKDFWKKMQDVTHVKSVIEWSRFTDKDTKCSVEFALREVMRKRKEVNVLKQVGYVWIAEVPKDIMIEEVMKHYFLENCVVVSAGDKVYHIGWNETLKGINMRYFVCPPL